MTKGSSTKEEFRLSVDERVGTVSAIVSVPKGATAAYVFAHGAGAGMTHPFMESVSELLFRARIAVMRYQFPYIEAGRRAPNPPRVLSATVSAAVAHAVNRFEGLPLFAGGKSMGGRMTSTCAAEQDLPLTGLIFFGFPLHAPGKPGVDRANHLRDVDKPMLFLQGSRDKLATPELLRSVLDNLADRTTLIEIEEGDHSLKVPKRTGRTHVEVLEYVVKETAEWIAQHS